MSNFLKVIDYLSTLPSHQRGKIFEHYCKWFLENDPRYAIQLKKVWLWQDWPKNWGRDKGIDLIAETQCGKLWAIQVKAYDETYYITKEDVDKFISESSRKEFSFRLLIATTNNLGPNAQEVILAQEKRMGVCLLDQLETSVLDWNCVLTHPSSYKKEIATPNPHQERALQDIFISFQNSDLGQLHMACGTGKTLIGLWLAEKLKSNTTLVLVPSISLVSQLYLEWANNHSDLFNFYPIFVCSDQTVGDKENDIDYHVDENINLGFPVTTCSAELLNELSSNTSPKVIFSTYHSSPVIKEACQQDTSLIFDIVIADEAHRCAGQVTSNFATVVHKEAIRAKHKLFMTATPKIFSANVKNKTQEFGYEIASMDDTEKFGPVLHKLPFSAAIKERLLSDYQVVISVMNNTMYREYAERGRFVSINNHETDARTLASQLLVAKAIKKYNLKKVISFHSRKKNAQTFINEMEIAINLLPDTEKPSIGFKNVIFGNMAQAERSKILKQFRESEEGCSLLGNVKCLSEGIDVPAIDGIAFIDPKGSEIEIVQAVGRVIRKPNKHSQKIGIIIIPIFIDGTTEETIALEQSCFKSVAKVVRALRAHDDTLAEELDTIRLELGKRSFRTPPKLNKIFIDVPVGISVEFADSLRTKLIEDIITHCSPSWDYQFALLKKFRQLHPNRWPHQHEEYPEGNNLGQWCSRQRQLFKKKILGSLKEDALNLIGFPWDNAINFWQKQCTCLAPIFSTTQK